MFVMLLLTILLHICLYIASLLAKALIFVVVCFMSMIYQLSIKYGFELSIDKFIPITFIPCSLLIIIICIIGVQSNECLSVLMIWVRTIVSPIYSGNNSSSYLSLCMFVTGKFCVTTLIPAILELSQLWHQVIPFTPNIYFLK